MSYQHPSLVAGRWPQFSLVEQLAHVGGEVIRALGWREKNRPDYCRAAIERALELLELTLADPKNRHRLKELTRLQETLLDDFEGENAFHSTPERWRSYFMAFSQAASLKKYPDLPGTVPPADPALKERR